MAKLVNLLAIAAKADASDVILAPDKTPYMKVAGKFTAFGETLSATDITTMLFDCLSPEQQEDYKALPKQRVLRAYKIDIPSVCTCRLTLYSVDAGISMAIRLIKPTGTLADYRLDNAVGFNHHGSGLVLIGGEQGSGVTTTCSALLNTLGQTPGQHIVMLEEVPEQSIQAQSGIVERIACTSIEDYLAVLQRLVSASVDILFVDRLFDYRIMHQVLCFAAAGCKVVSTLAINKPLWLIEFFVNQFPQSDREWIQTFLLAHCVQVFCQQLTLDAETKLAYQSFPITHASAKAYREKAEDLHDAIIRGVA